MLSFYKRNWRLFFANHIFLFGFFGIGVVLPTMLVKDHNYSDSYVLFSGFFSMFFYLIGIFSGKKIMEYKFNYISFVKTLFLISIFFQICLYFFITSSLVDDLKYLFIFYRGGDGFINGIAYILTSSIFTFELTKNKSRLEIVSLNYTLAYGLKIFAPIFAGIVAFYLSNQNVILTSIIFYATAILLLTDLKSLMFARIHRRRVKHFEFKSNRFNFRYLSQLKFNIDPIIFSRLKNLKIEIYRIIFINNSFRSFYDVALILMLTNGIGISLIKAGFVFSAMVGGQSLNIIGMIFVKYLIKKFPNKHIFATAISIYAPTLTMIALLLFLLHNPVFNDYYYSLILLNSFLIGLSRTFFASIQEHYYYIFVEDDKQNVMEYSSFKLIISEFGHICGYLLSSFALIFGYTYFLLQLLFFIVLQVYLSSKFSLNK